MSKKDDFITMVEDLLKPIDISETVADEHIKNALEYFEELKNSKPREKVELTENGAKILAYMQANWQQYNNVFKSKEIGEGIFVSSRSVSGSMKKLITEGFVEKIGTDPIAYAITDKGKNRDLSNI